MRLVERTVVAQRDRLNSLVLAAGSPIGLCPWFWTECKRTLRIFTSPHGKKESWRTRTREEKDIKRNRFRVEEENTTVVSSGVLEGFWKAWKASKLPRKNFVSIFFCLLLPSLPRANGQL